MSSRQSRGSRHQSMSQATRYSGTVSAPLGYLGSLDTEELQVPAMSVSLHMLWGSLTVHTNR